MEINEKYTRDKILIFDVDDTLVITPAKIKVTDTSTGKVFQLTPQEYNEYEKNKDHVICFNEFKCLEIMKAGMLIDKYFKILKKNYNKGIAIGIITARDNREMIYEWLRFHVGFHIDKRLVWAIHDPVHGLEGSIDERKKAALKWFIEQGYTDITFFDDDKKNIKLAKQLNRETPQIKLKTHLVKRK